LKHDLVTCPEEECENRRNSDIDPQVDDEFDNTFHHSDMNGDTEIEISVVQHEDENHGQNTRDEFDALEMDGVEAPIHEGYLLKQAQHGMKRWRKRWVVVEASSLTYYNSPKQLAIIREQNDEGIVKSKLMENQIKLADCKIRKVIATKSSINISSPNIFFNRNLSADLM